MPLQIGALLSERYRITRVLGQGGMGAVYLATDESLGQPCAVKENLNLSPDSERLFRREATLLATLRHRHLPRVTNHFVSANQQYLVMDFVEGEDLKQRLERQSPLPERLVLQWAAQLCDALGYLHGLTPPIVHRDIKPANIKLTPSGEIMLVDFGVARPTTPGDQKTATNTLAYTPGFTPPEQYGLGRTDARADQYALAATLYTLLTAQAPPDSVERLLGNVTLIPPNALRPELSAGLVAALTRALAVQPGDRYPTVAAFRAALAGAPPAAAEATIVRRPEPAPAPAAAPPADAGATLVRRPEPAPAPAAAPAPPATLFERPAPPPAADATLVNPRAVTPSGPPVPDGPTMPVPTIPPPTMFERPSAPPPPATLYEPIKPPSTPPPAFDDPSGPPPGPMATLMEAGGLPPAPPPIVTMPYAVPGQPAASPRPRWLLPVVGCGLLLLVIAAIAGGSALGLYFNQPTATSTVGVTLLPASATGPAATDTAPAPEPTATLAAEASATLEPEVIATLGAPPTETQTAAPSLTPAPSATSTPAGTPIGSGARLAFISDRDGQFFQVYTMAADGSDVQQLTTDAVNKWSPDWPYNGTQLAWSPDGTQLLYVADGGGSNGLDLWLIDADGANPQNLTHTPGDDIQPSWCGDGTIWFASTRISGVHQIFGTSLASLTQGLKPFNFSGTHNNPREFDPAAYPGCQRLVFTSTLDGPNELWRYWPDCEACYRKVRTYKDQNGRAEEPAVSPDGTLLAYTRVLAGATEVILANLDDRTTNTQLTSSLNNFSAQWSPDGQWLTFVSLRDGNREVYVMTLTGAQQTNLSQNAATDTDPVWQPAAP